MEKIFLKHFFIHAKNKLCLYIFFLSFIFALETNFSAEARLRVENFHDNESSTSATASYFRSRLSADLKKKYL